MQVSIIVPTYNNYKILKNCVDSILLNTDMSDKELIIVANGCVDETKEYLKTLPAFVKTIWEDSAIGFVRAINSGLHIAQGEYIVLLNDDVVLLDVAWLPLLIQPFNNNPKCGMSGPCKWWYPINGKKYPQLAFWCAMFKRSILIKTGYLDDIFNPGNGDDIDFCMKVNKLGYEIIGTPDNWKYDGADPNPSYTRFPITHLGGTTFSKNHEETMKLRHKSAAILEERYKE